MPLKKPLMALFWVAAISVPVAASLLAIAQLSTDVEVPMHWNAQGHVDRFGSPWEMLPPSLIMAGCNLLLALCYVFSDRLFDLGLVHGISRRTTRPFLCGTAVFMVLVWVGALIFWLHQVGKAPL